MSRIKTRRQAESIRDGILCARRWVDSTWSVENVYRIAEAFWPMVNPLARSQNFAFTRTGMRARKHEPHHSLTEDTK